MKKNSLKFKRLNVGQYARERSLDYFLCDLLRQTAVEQCVEAVKFSASKKWLKNYLLCRVNCLLEEMIIE